MQGLSERGGEAALSVADSDAVLGTTTLGARARSYDRLDALVADVVAAARPGDHVLVMSNGGFGGVHQKLLDALGT